MASEVSAQDKAFGSHANEFETAWLLALVPQHVKAERAVCDYVGSITDPGELRAEQTAATYAWTTQDVSKTGIMGDAPAGTREKGLKWLPQFAQGFADSIVKINRELKGT